VGARIDAAARLSAEKSCEAGNRILAYYGLPAEFVPADSQTQDYDLGVDGYLRWDRGIDLGTRPVGMRWQAGRVDSTVTFRDRGGIRSELHKRARDRDHRHLTLHSYWYPDNGTLDLVYLVRTVDAVDALHPRIQINPEDGTPFRFADVHGIPYMGHSRWDPLCDGMHPRNPGDVARILGPGAAGLMRPPHRHRQRIELPRWYIPWTCCDTSVAPPE